MSSIAILESVKDFLVKLVNDPTFALQLQSSSMDQQQQLMQEAGYTFSATEFEVAAIQILELQERDEWHELTDAELAGAVGGWMHRFSRWTPREPVIQPLYGVMVDPPESTFPPPRPRPNPRPLPNPTPQPMYGVVIEPPMTIQPMYGVVIYPDIG
jgi:predicted ribosomally synthesized peptide with nif11-like leader